MSKTALNTRRMRWKFCKYKLRLFTYLPSEFFLRSLSFTILWLDFRCCFWQLALERAFSDNVSRKSGYLRSLKSLTIGSSMSRKSFERLNSTSSFSTSLQSKYNVIVFFEKDIARDLIVVVSFSEGTLNCLENVFELELMSIVTLFPFRSR